MCSKVQQEKDYNIVKIIRLRKNVMFVEYYKINGITHEFSAPKTPQQNLVVKHKNRTIQEMARVILNVRGISFRFWAEAMNTAWYTINIVYLRHSTNTIFYEI